MEKLKVAIIFGGCSEEHDVSVKSAKEIAKHLDTNKYLPTYVGISKTGVWKICPTPTQGWDNEQCKSAIISPDKSMGGLLVESEHGYSLRPIDVVFCVIHGKTGEDGAIQGLLELSGIPYVGCDIPTSVICMDKSLTYMVTKNAGIKTPGFLIVDDGNPLDLSKINYPVFVKPARSGSSFGVTKVENEEKLLDAIKTAKQYDSKVLIENTVVGIEVGCAVFGNGDQLSTGEVDMISLTHGIFKIHQEKDPEKGSENSSITVPAKLPLETRQKVQKTAKKIYKALGCRGLARVDMFYTENGEIVLNEVNTMPGFTSYSRYSRMMTVAGISVPTLIDKFIELARKE